MHNDEDVSEITEMAVKRIDAVAEPAHGTPFLLLKSKGPGPELIGLQLIKASPEIPASGPGEAASILAAVTGERGTSRACSGRTADGSPCQRPVVDGDYCHHHIEKGDENVTTTKKVEKDPIAALDRLEKAASQLPARHPARVHAAQLVLFHKMRMTHAGSMAKAVSSISANEAAAIAASAREVAGAIRAPAQDLLPTPPSRRDQLAAVRDGTYEPATLAGQQNPDIASIYTSPAASLGQIQKSDEHRLDAAEAAFAKAKADGTAADIARAGEQVTIARLSLFHAATGR